MPSGPAQVLDRKVVLTRAVLLFEHIWRAMLWPFAVAGLFLLISFANLWSYLPPNAHTLLLVVCGLAGLASLAPLFRITLPGREAALRRLESVSGLEHRPATSYEDTLPAAATEEQRALWSVHRQRLTALFASLRPGLPHPRLDRADPYALRAALLLLVTVSLVSAGPEARTRITSAFKLTPVPALAQFRLDAWVTPPLYTGKPPIVLADGLQNQSMRRVTVPEKSLLLVRINHGASAKPLLHIIDPDGGRKTLDATSADGGLAEYRVTVTKNAAVEVALGPVPAVTWHFDLIPDTPPTIALTEDPSRTPRGSLRLEFRAQDDYGIAQAEARFELADNGDSNNEEKLAADMREGLAPPIIPLNLPRANAKIAEARVFRDLTAHPWAGLRVKMTLAARDQAGQSGFSNPYELILPARKFTKPLAKAIIEQRRNLVRDPRARNDVAQGLAALTIGAEHFIDDTIVYLGLRSAFWRLKTRPAEDTAASIVAQLWDLALRVEDGDLPEAQAALRAAQEKLRRALEEGAPEEEIQRFDRRIAGGTFAFHANARRARAAQRQPRADTGRAGTRADAVGQGPGRDAAQHRKSRQDRRP